MEIAIVLMVFEPALEGEIIDKIHSADEKYDGIVIYAGAFTHYSYAIRDAIEAISGKVVEVHLSNIYNRESFRQNSVIAPVCLGSISGFGRYGYILAVRSLIHRNHKVG